MDQMNQSGYITQIKKVQKRFHHMVGCKFGMIDTSTNILAKVLTIISLEDRLFNNVILFLFLLLINLIDCP